MVAIGRSHCGYFFPNRATLDSRNIIQSVRGGRRDCFGGGADATGAIRE
jgi:hypothetical protein